MINKNKLVFDPADSDNSDFVGSYVIGADGTKITHTNTGGKDGLDVNVINTVVVSATDLDIRNLVFATDKVDVSGSSVALDAGTLAALESITVQNGAGASAVNIQDGGNSITVDAVNLDIRDLAFATDKVDVSGSTILVALNSEHAEDSASADGDIGQLILAVRHDADTSLVGADGDYGALQLDSLGRLKVAADISVVNGFEKAEDAAHSSGDIGGYVLSVRQDTLSASAGDGDYQSFKTDALGRIYANNAHQTMANAAVSVLVTATDLAATDLANRKRILIQNLGTKKIYIGKDNTVTTSNGIELFAGASMELDIGAGVNVHAISSSGTQDVRVMELA